MLNEKALAFKNNDHSIFEYIFHLISFQMYQTCHRNTISSGIKDKIIEVLKLKISTKAYEAS